MLIDFHTHYFPDKIAKDTVEKLAETGNVPYFGDGTLAGLKDFMKQDGVSISVNLPIATRPEQVVSINRKMIEANRRDASVINFGTLHPDFAGFEEELSFLKANGIRGIKLHPEYQTFCPEEKRMFAVYESCAKHGIAILFHAGVDLGYTEVHCTPRGMTEILEIQGLTVILAHMGGYQLWDDVEKYLVGKPVYFDLAFCNEMDNAQLKRMIVAHGSEKILFASDFPWERASVIKAKIDSLDLSSADAENIFHKSAERLLKL